VTAEHVVTTCPHALQSHAEAGPDHQRSLQLGPPTTIDLHADRHTYRQHDYTLQGHAEAGLDHQSPLQLGPPTTIDLHTDRHAE